MRPLTTRHLRKLLWARHIPQRTAAPPMAPKDWITLSVSILALIVSTLTAYWTIVRRVDDLRVVITGSPLLIFEKDIQGINFYLTNGNITFLNLGNRPAAVTRIYLALSPPSSG